MIELNDLLEKESFPCKLLRTPSNIPALFHFSTISS
jgi:hypothetical protein